MNSIEKQFIPYTLALKLKELSFNKPCFAWYDANSFSTVEIEYDYKENIDLYYKESCTAPLWQQAFDWFRDEFDYNVSIYGRKSMGYDYRINNILINSVRDTIISDYVWKTYEEARLACLEKLIEIIRK